MSVKTVATFTCSVCKFTATSDGSLPQGWSYDPYDPFGAMSFTGGAPTTHYCNGCILAAREAHTAALAARKR